MLTRTAPAYRCCTRISCHMSLLTLPQHAHAAEQRLPAHSAKTSQHETHMSWNVSKRTLNCGDCMPPHHCCGCCCQPLALGSTLTCTALIAPETFERVILESQNLLRRHCTRHFDTQPQSRIAARCHLMRAQESSSRAIRQPRPRMMGATMEPPPPPPQDPFFSTLLNSRSEG